MSPNSISNEAAHYVVTAHPPGAVLMTAKCNFVSPDSTNVLIAKSRRLEIRKVRSNSDESSAAATASSPFPLVCTVPIYGRITALEPFKVPLSSTSYVFCMTERQRYAVLSYSQDDSSSSSPIVTHASGSFQDYDSSILGQEAECGPLVSIDPYNRCIAIHFLNGLLTIIPINLGYDGSKAGQNHQEGRSKRRFAAAKGNLLGEPYHGSMEERNVLDIAFGHTLNYSSGTSASMPLLSLLHQDSSLYQHVTTHVVDLKKKKLLLHGSVHAKNYSLLKKSCVDGGSARLLAVKPPPPVPMGRPKRTGEEDEDEDEEESNKVKGGLLVLGQRQITYLSMGVAKVIPISQALIVAACLVPGTDPQFLLGDEFGNLMLLSVRFSNSTGVMTGLELNVLGTTNICSSIDYLDNGLVFVGSQFGDSQLVQIRNDAEPNPSSLEATSCLDIVEEYTHLGPIVDFDLVPTSYSTNGDGGGGKPDQAQSQQSQVVTASGTSFSGTLRLVRNGIGMNEYAAVEIPGIQNMWNIRANWKSKQDSYLVQSFVGETRVLGVKTAPAQDVVMQNEDDEEEDDDGALEETFLAGLDSHSSSLFVGNVQVGDSIVQVTESEIRLIDSQTLECVDTWSPASMGGSQRITVASGNASGQIAIALEGGLLVYLVVTQRGEGCKVEVKQQKEMEQEISCINLNPFTENTENAMDIDDDTAEDAIKSKLVAVGLWDDFTVRLLALEEESTMSPLQELLEINLSNEDDEEEKNADQAQPNAQNRGNRNNMMARSLCLVTLDSPSSSGSHSGGVNMLFVGLGDGTLVSFAVVSESNSPSVRSRKQTSLGTQRISLVPLYTQGGGTCVLATGDRPTVIYLAGGGGSGGVNFSNPKLCYSNVNLSTTPEDAEEEESDGISRPPAQQSIAIHVATPFSSSVLFDTNLAQASGKGASQQYSLCVANETNLRLGVIDDIQKLHVTTCRLGMTPRRVVHCPEGRLFAVGCLESGVRDGGTMDTDATFGNCIRFLDDTSFEDMHRVDLEPHELILSMAKVNLTESNSSEMSGNSTSSTGTKPFLLVGTAYVFADEDEPTNGRILVYSCSNDQGIVSGNGAVRQVTELSVHGGVYSMCQFYQGMALVSVNSKTQVCQLVDDGTGIPKLKIVGIGHHGHILSLFVQSRAHLTVESHGPSSEAPSVAAASAAIPVLHETPTKKKAESDDDQEYQGEQLAIVGDLMRSISLVQYYPKHETLEEIARDFNANFTTALEMLTDEIYLGAENFNNLFVLRRNTKAQSDEVRCRLDTVGEYHLGEMVNKFKAGCLIMPQGQTPSSSDSEILGINRRPTGLKSPVKGDGNKKPAARTRRPTVVIGSQTLFGTVDGSLGVILGLDRRTAVFFAALERAMERTIPAAGDFHHFEFRTFQAEKRIRPSHGFVDGDLVESFLDLDKATMEAVVREMNEEDGWEIEENLTSSGEARGGSVSTVLGSAMSDGEGENELASSTRTLTVDDVLAMVEEMTMLH